MADENRSSAWIIANGILLAAIVLVGIPRLYEAYQYRQAMKAFNQQMVELQRPDADPFGWRAATDKNNRRAAAEQAAKIDANALKPGERCISGQRFAVVNGELRDVSTC